MSMSTLFRLEEINIIHSTSLTRDLELRQSSPIFVVRKPPGPVTSFNPAEGQVLRLLYTNLKTNLLYTATIQLALNGSQPSWSLNGWSFTPIDISKMRHTNSGQQFNDRPLNDSLTNPSRVSVSTPAIRGGLECSAYQSLDNHSAWIDECDLTNSWVWNTTFNPQGLGKGYELLTPFFNTSVLANPSQIQCCVNGTTRNSKYGKSAIGYWSLSEGTEGFSTTGSKFLRLETRRLRRLTTKWIHGNLQRRYYRNSSTIRYNTAPFPDVERFIYDEIPAVEALDCLPIIETAQAYVTADNSGQVDSFRILDEPTEATPAWASNFFRTRKWKEFSNIWSSYEVGVSYGALFLTALVEASEVLRIDGPSVIKGWDPETLEDNTFNYRDNDVGLNLDFMTYAMYRLAGRDPKALLNASTMEAHAQMTFATFFQHYGSSNVSMETGSWAYEPINASSRTNKTAIAEVASPAKVLRMNSVAVWLSIVILAWLMIMAIIMAVVMRRHLKNLHKDIECIDDVLVLGYGSDKLLELIRTEGMEELWRRKDEIMVKLGYFEDSAGD